MGKAVRTQWPVCQAASAVAASKMSAAREMVFQFLSLSAVIVDLPSFGVRPALRSPA
jgi:hypothetical protein